MYDDDYEIPGAFPAGGMGGGMFGNPAMGGAVAPNRGGGGGIASLFDNPMFMGGMMGLSNLRDPNSMGKAMQAMMDMRQSQQMMDYRNRSLDETSRFHTGALDVDKARSALLQQQVQGQQDQMKMVRDVLPMILAKHMQGQQPTGMTAQAMQPPPVSDAQPMNNPSAFVAQGGNPAERPEQNNDMTAPVFGNEVQGQSLPPAGQPQPTPGGNNASQFPSSAQSGMGVDQAPPSPDLVKAHFRTAIIGAEGGTNPDGSFRTSTLSNGKPGAIGPAQVMPATAPEAAKLAGLPFDDNKYRTDPDYNMALGEAYYKKQFDTFGNIPMADAAYNAGPGALLTAQNRATKMGNPNAWLSFMPQETQKYVQKTTGFTGGMVPQQLTKPGVADAQAQLQPPPQAPQAPPQAPPDQSQWAMQQGQPPQAPPQGQPPPQQAAPQQAPPQAPPAGGQQIAQVPGLPQIPGMPQQPTGQQGITAPDDSEQRRNQVALGLVMTANPATMAEGLKMINAAGETKTYNKGQIVTNADGKPIMIDGPPTEQEKFNNAIAAGKDYREALGTAMEVGKYPGVLKQMAATFEDTQAQTKEREAAAAKTRQEVANTNTVAQMGILSMKQATDSLRQSYANLDKAGAISNTDRSALENARAYAIQSGPGQILGQIVGSKIQTDLNDIKMAQPQLMAGLMHSTGIKSTQMNSDKELGFYVGMATDPKAGYQSNMHALDRLDQYEKWAIQHQQATDTTFKAFLADSGLSMPAAGSGTPPLGSKDNPMTLDQYNKSRK